MVCLIVGKPMLIRCQIDLNEIIRKSLMLEGVSEVVCWEVCYWLLTAHAMGHAVDGPVRPS